jgi:metal-responsive CopG/Arc/MetJ family transcriptional regulator
MKTIAISIDAPTLAAIDRIARTLGKRSGRGERGKRAANRSQVIRDALQRFVEQHERRNREAEERKVLAKHREKLGRQLGALITEQAEP